jgi:hypothetical protein
MKMVRRSRALAVGVLLGAGALQVLGVQPALAAHQTTGLYDYTSTAFSGQCSTGGSGTLSASTAQVSRTGSTISVSVQLVGAQPNSAYDAALLQAGACFDQSASYPISTDSSGDGSAQFTVQSAAPPGQDPLIVDVVVPISCVSPCPPTEPAPAYRSATLKV